MRPWSALFARNAAQHADPVDRLIGLPRVVYDPALSEIEALRRTYTDGRPESETGTLRLAQGAGLLAMQDTRDERATGAVLMLGCGHGKTLIGQLAPTVYGAQRPRVIIPAALRNQYVRDADAWRRKGWRIRGDLADTIASYETLSAPQHRDALWHWRPDLLVFDEAHLLGNADSARYKRIARYLDEHDWCRVVVLSGTLTDRSIMQMEHLMYAALRGLSPLPRDEGSLVVWSSVFDHGTEPTSADMAYMGRLAHWAGEDATRAGVRRAFRARLRTTRGVVVSASVSASVSLRVRLWQGPRAPEAVQQARDQLAQSWTLPDGTMLVDAFEFDRYARTLAFGHWSRWIDGTGHPEWHERRKAWSAVVRAMVEYGGLDSPAIVAERAEANMLAARHVDAYQRWRAVADDEPDKALHWVSGGQEYALDVVDQWRTRCTGLYGADEPGVVWAHSRTLGACLGTRTPYHGAGSAAPVGGFAVVSSDVHGRGWNGQHYARQLILEPQAGAGWWQQLLARLHRPGQTRDVDTTVFVGTPYLRAAWFKARQGAQYVQDLTGEPQRVLICDVEE